MTALIDGVFYENITFFYTKEKSFKKATEKYGKWKEGKDTWKGQKANSVIYDEAKQISEGKGLK